MNEAERRKGQPVFSGVLAYFPDALLAISEHSKAGNDQHNPGQPLHWERSKSQDESDALARHLIDHAKEPADLGHLKAVAWRALALLQKAIEAQQAKSAATIGCGAYVKVTRPQHPIDGCVGEVVEREFSEDTGLKLRVQFRYGSEWFRESECSIG